MWMMSYYDSHKCNVVLRKSCVKGVSNKWYLHCWHLLIINFSEQTNKGHFLPLVYKMNTTLVMCTIKTYCSAWVSKVFTLWSKYCGLIISPSLYCKLIYLVITILLQSHTWYRSSNYMIYTEVWIFHTVDFWWKSNALKHTLT